MKRIVTLLCFMAFAAVITADADTLTVNEYIAQVKAQSPEVRSASLAVEAASNKISELDMAYSPFLSAGVNYLLDKGGAGFGSTLPTSQMEMLSLNFGLTKRWATGSSLTLGYTDTRAAFKLLYPTQITATSVVSEFAGYDVKPSVTVSQSLWKEWGDGQAVSGIKKTRALSRQGEYMQLLRRQQLIARSRVAYWSLALANEVEAFRKTSLDRAEELLRWSEKRLKLDLVDASDLLQAQAAYKLRQLNYKLAQEETVRARRAFNELRGKPGIDVSDELEKISDAAEYYGTIKELQYGGERADVLAARAASEASAYALSEAVKRTGPELSVFGTGSLHGLDLSYSSALTQVANADKPAYGAGIVFTAPLDFKTPGRARKGYLKDSESAKQALIKAELTARNDWEELVRGWTNVRQRMTLAAEIRDIQEKRAQNEQKKYERGRTTTFLLLNAENDRDDATLNVYRMIFEELSIIAQAELYNTHSSSPLFQRGD